MPVVVGGIDNSIGQRVATKTVTFTGASTLGLAGTNTTWFTVTGGLVVVQYLAGRVTTNTAVGGAATITLGITGSTALFIGATTASGLVTTAEIWESTTPTANGIAAAAALKDIIIDQNIISAVAAFNITAGVIEMNCVWRPLTPGAVLA
jgi:hypothetical protein